MADQPLKIKGKYFLMEKIYHNLIKLNGIKAPFYFFILKM